MFVGVKIVDADGNLKGRAYSYETDLDLCEGDLVIADMAGMDKLLAVVETDVEIGEVDFEIKKIKRVAGDEDMPVGLIDIQIVDEQLPIIKINYEEIKSALNDMLAKYKGIVVTEKTLAACKAAQKDLAGVRTKVNRYRIDKARELALPIKAFENQCKELIELIESVEGPIKEGISYFDDQKKNKKRQDALELIDEVVNGVGLNAKYVTQLTVLDKYCNLTAKKQEVKDDLMARATALKAQQSRDEEMLSIITSTIEMENERLEAKLSMNDFARLIDAGLSPAEVIAQVKSQADRLHAAENAPEKSTVEKPTVESETVNEMSGTRPEKEPLRYATFTITGTAVELMAVSAYLKGEGMKYVVVDQGVAGEMLADYLENDRM